MFEECLEKFTPDELKQIQDNRAYIQGDYLSFDNDITDELTKKIEAVYAEALKPYLMDGQTRVDVFFNLIKYQTEFAHALGVTLYDPKDTPEKALRLFFDNNTAQLQITHKNYSGALYPYKNDYAYIVNFDNQLRFTWDDDGTPHIVTSDEQIAFDELLNKKNIPANCADTDLLSTLAAAVRASHISNKGDKITVSLPNFARALGVRIENHPEKDAAHDKFFDFWGKIKQLENIGGVIVEQKKILRAFVFLSYNEEKNELTFSSPYLYSLMDILKSNPAKEAIQKVNNRPKYSILGISYLINANIITARNKITAEISKYLVCRLLQAGSKTDATKHPGRTYKNKNQRTCSITYQDLIKDVPELKNAWKTADAKQRAQILRRSILGTNYDKPGKDGKIKNTSIIEDYMRDYTQAFNFWVELKIEVEPVSMKTLSNKIIFTHEGINGDYDENLRIPHEENNVGSEENNVGSEENRVGSEENRVGSEE